MDDLISGASTIQEASSLCKKITAILDSAGMELRKWAANDSRILEEICTNKHITAIEDFGQEKCKTLGLQWSWNTDELGYKINKTTYQINITKRSILSESAQIFDPLGLLAPCVITVKIILQQLWSLKISWDDPVPSNLKEKWLQLRSDLQDLNNLKIPRHIFAKNYITIELHVFCDSSQQAYGACIYARSRTPDNQIYTKLICGKGKVAPLKVLTIPRLELCGAVVLTNLMEKVKTSLNIKTRCFYWTDSQIVLSWLRMESTILQTFVANRVAEIQRSTSIDQWQHVHSEENPADLISTGVRPLALQDQTLWWHGPTWLNGSNDNWPTQKSDLIPIENLQEVKKQTAIHKIQEKPSFFLWNKYSSFTRLIRITALCLRFIHNCKDKQHVNHCGTLSVSELENSLNVLIRISQQESFESDIQSIKQGKNLDRNSSLQTLAPFLDNEMILRVGGRIRNSPLDYHTKHPILLSSKHRLTVLIFEWKHRELLHVGPQMLLYTIREKYWVINGRNLARKTVHQCIKCVRAKPTTIVPLMGNLPAERITPALPFSITGTDYAGPFLLRERLGRGKSNFKCYICIFICMTTKAIHLEPVTDLTTDSFIATLKRFIARRGTPTHLYSDNGTTYVKASKELHELSTFITNHNSKLSNVVSDLGINWHFIPPYAPKFGGLWEAAVKSTKFHLKRILTETSLTFEYFLTLLVTIEGILNSRPLTPMSSDPHDYQALTPAHFLIGRTITAIPEVDLTNVKQNRLSCHQHTQQLRQQFWHRWSKEYIGQLQQRSKWNRNQKSIKVGTLVLLKENHLPTATWRLGRISDVHPGTDGVIRVVSIQTTSGIQRRPVSRVCPLPLEPEDAEKKPETE